MSFHIRVLLASFCALTAVILAVGLIAAVGGPVWQADGVALCLAPYDQEEVQIAPDESGGAIVTWKDHRSVSDKDIYAQRVYSDGTPAWQTDGVSLCVASNDQQEPQIASDGSGGAIVT
jgi:hypothetical protein